MWKKGPYPGTLFGWIVKAPCTCLAPSCIITLISLAHFVLCFNRCSGSSRSSILSPSVPRLCKESYGERPSCHALQTSDHFWSCGHSGMPCHVAQSLPSNPKYLKWSKSAGGGFTYAIANWNRYLYSFVKQMYMFKRPVWRIFLQRQCVWRHLDVWVIINKQCTSTVWSIYTHTHD